jgi:hypothetical protein
MPELTVEQRVANGVWWLNANKPGWEALINLEALDIEEPCRCVIGQVFGDYHESLFGQPGRLAHQVAANHGFNSNPPTSPEYDGANEYAALEAEWIRVVEARRAGTEARREAATHG